MNQALILIDIQNIYFTPGKYQLFNPEIAADNAHKVLHHFRQNKLPIIHVKHMFESNLENNEYLCNFYKSVQPINDETIIEKEHPSAFFKTMLKKVLDRFEIDTIVIAGMMSHMCIDTTVRAAYDLNYQVTVLDNACTTYDLNYNEEIIPANLVHKVFMSALNDTFANVINVEEFISNN